MILPRSIDITTLMSQKSSHSRYEFPVIGVVQSCFKEKFGVPRQPGLAPAARASIAMQAPYGVKAAFDGLESCSHIWLQFVFHLSLREQWKPKVRPPRLGGNASLGVFATRSPVRPAAIGLSVVRLESIEDTRDGILVHIGGCDLVEGTPILDIKPYVPYVDCVADAHYAIASDQPPHIPVRFSLAVERQLEACDNHSQLVQLIVQVLQQDPRPKYQKHQPDRVYGMLLLEYNLQWCYRQLPHGEEIEVLGLHA
ncbi:tRNA (N6-threonylcarbamoyladenosine(37)-N6)-methyltransferase TrmO [Teredinibacter turnerae]|uniref:tRNA (N6-threonylcarbamoyladenosine(37)-N6)-methyltransferase TrmO n=1 Tax=Teredinibacter turnerae TaxID=2426 RepID=UPI000381C5A6|nr:tRNA (N6-threonylcarbamoyladenosine(37)-N6)-methyltransferase TrmO [Teredinibacter turnerae]